MKIEVPFVGPFYQLRSLNADAQEALNCYLEMDVGRGQGKSTLYGTPGMVKHLTFPRSPVRGGFAEAGKSWWVAGDTVYSVDNTLTATSIGTILTSEGRISMASNGLFIIIVDGTAGYLIDCTLSTVTQISDPDFPNGVKSCTFQDGYFIVAGNDSQSFFINQTPYDGGTWDALDFASAEGSPDNTIGVISDHEELLLFGSLSAELWTNTGSGDMPFSRAGNVFMEEGTASAQTICKADNSVFWLGSGENGAGMVWRADGYTPVRISNHALEHAIAGYNLATAFAFVYRQEGHTFYVLTFPTDSKTWVFDASTQQWHERAWRDPDTGELSRWRANCHVFAHGKHLVGDYENGNLYSLDLDTYTDNDDPILRRRRTICTEKLQSRLFYSSFQVNMETGVGLATGQGETPLLMLRYSNDAGHTWSNEKRKSIGKIGEYGARVKFSSLGSGRNRVWEISMTDPVKFVVLGAVAEVEEGI